MKRSGQALNAATTRATSKDTVSKYTKSAFEGNFSAKSGDTTTSGTASAKFDSNGAVADASATLKGEDGVDKKVSAQLIMNLAKEKLYPTIYLKFSGLGSLGLGYLDPLLKAYDNKWLLIDQDTFKAFGVDAPKATDVAQQQVTAQDVADTTKAAVQTTTEYIFSTDPSKAVWQRQSFVGREKVDSIDTYHYKVTINTDHMRAYCRAVTTQYLQSKVAQKIIPDAAEREQQIKSVPDDCKADITDENIGRSTYDLWIDMRYKVIYKVRATDKDNAATYSELGQKYDGSDTLHFFVKSVSQDKTSEKSPTRTTMAATVDMNTSAATVGAGLSASTSGGSADESYDFKATMSSKPYAGNIDTGQPGNVTPLLEILQGLTMSSPTVFSPDEL